MLILHTYLCFQIKENNRNEVHLFIDNTYIEVTAILLLFFVLKSQGAKLHTSLQFQDCS